MNLTKKLSQRLFDPVFYRKRAAELKRHFSSLEEGPVHSDPAILGRVRKTTLVIAHPDDETFCSGMLRLLALQGCGIRVICVTRGEGGPTGGHDRKDLGKIRSREMEEACRVLGVEDLIFLAHVDPEAREFQTFAPEVSAEDLAGELVSHKIADSDLVISHGSDGEYWHPGHLLVHDAVRQSLGALPANRGPAWLTFMSRWVDHPLARFLNWDDTSFLRFEMSESIQRDRLKALECHGSQLGLFGRFTEGSHVDFIAQTGTESCSLQRGSEALHQLP